MKRKCAQCKEAIEIDNNNIVDVICYEKSYYHKHCFCALAEKRSQSKRGKPEKWQAALNNIYQIEAETVQTLRSLCAKDELNAWLLEHYDITAVPARFWQIVADLECGKYKGRQCKPVSMDTLLGAWKWGQRKLNKINANNKAKSNWKMDDSQRVLYDLAIIASKVPLYLLKKTEKEAAERERQLLLQEKIKIDYKSIAKKAEELDDDEVDISSIVDDIF